MQLECFLSLPPFHHLPLHFANSFSSIQSIFIVGLISLVTLCSLVHIYTLSTSHLFKRTYHLPTFISSFSFISATKSLFWCKELLWSVKVFESQKAYSIILGTITHIWMCIDIPLGLLTYGECYWSFSYSIHQWDFILINISIPSQYIRSSRLLCLCIFFTMDANIPSRCRYHCGSFSLWPGSRNRRFSSHKEIAI